MFCWQPVTTNCDGGPEIVAAYRHEIAYIRVVGTQPCSDNPADGYCPLYIRENFIESITWPSECLPSDPPNPGPGEVLLIRATAIDAAGNEDCGR